MKVELKFPLSEEGKRHGTQTIYILSEEELATLNETGEVTCHDEGEKSGGRRIFHSSIILRVKGGKYAITNTD